MGLYSLLQPSDDEMFVRECEAVLSDRLTAPATYDRIDASSQLRGSTSFEQFMDIDSPEKMKIAMMGQAVSAEGREAFEAKKKLYSTGDYETVTIILTYDSANAYGTPVRGRALCSQIVDKGKPVATGILSGTRIDGFDRIGWSTYQIWLLQQ